MSYSVATFIKYLSLYSYLLLILSGCAATESKKLAMRQALVIGNSNYQVSPLENPKNDAQDMAASLEALGFDVTLLLDLDKHNLENKVEHFFKTRVTEQTQLFFYYAGHAIQQHDKNFLIPVNNQILPTTTFDSVSYNLEVLMSHLRKQNPDLSILVMDACRNNPYEGTNILPSSRSLANEFRGLKRSKGLAEVKAPANTLIAFATSPGNVAADGEGRNGTYTKYLLKNMTTPRVSVDRIFSQVRAQVINETQGKQIPWEHSSLYKYDFFLVKPETAPKIRATW
ncbi:caspase domain-containing protein [Pseudoalteromonas atlantica]|uniref:caspase family protein n=1 Tax=Pseudoalteromonas atlantica TaxID=288 RepID=UPI0037370236